MADLAADPTLRMYLTIAISSQWPLRVEITDYSATQATLEQVFLRFASAQDKEED